MQKILVILGPTATGKSSLGIELAKMCNGEIVSADSRQVYRGLDVGTGKVPQDKHSSHPGLWEHIYYGFFKKTIIDRDVYMHSNIPHYLLNMAEPTKVFTVAEYKKLADEAILDILSRNKLPIVVGGTGFYIQAVVDNILPPEVPPNEKLRTELEQKTPEQLFEMLVGLDPDRAETVEPENKRRLIRAIEIAEKLGSVPKLKFSDGATKFQSLQIGLDLPDEKLRENIQKRVRERLANGWIKEVEKLLSAGVPLERLREFGLGYALIAKNAENLEERITAAEWQYAKRQRGWFKRDKRIVWCNPFEKEVIENKIKKFLQS